jgi:hypothetical protein
MKIVLLFTCAITLLTTTGCFFPGRGGGGGHWHDRGEVNGARPVVAVVTPELMKAPLIAAQPAPEVIEAPPVVAARVVAVNVP